MKKNNINNKNKLHCLIVEDNIQAAEILAIFFKRNGISFETAENGETGLKMYLENPLKYNLIFLDLEMPVMNGYEMAKRIRESDMPMSNKIPIIVMSGTYTNVESEEGLFNYFIKKPFKISCLINIINEVI